MMTLRIAMLSLIFLMVLCALSFGQPTVQDKADAVIRAKEFSQRLRRTQDLKTLLPDFFTTNFMRGIDRDSGHNTLVFLKFSKQHKIRLTARERERFYFASMNWMFLIVIYNCWKKPPNASDDDDDYKIVFPPGVKKILGKTKFFSLFLSWSKFNNMTEAQLMKMFPQSRAEVEVLSNNLECMNVMYRKNMGPLRRMSDEEFESVLAMCRNSSEDLYRVEMAGCNDKGNCPGVPNRVPLIGVKAPPFDFIDFARLSGKMKIVRLFLWDESLIK